MTRKAQTFRAWMLFFGALILLQTTVAHAQTQTPAAASTNCRSGTPVQLEACRLVEEGQHLARLPSPRWRTAINRFRRACDLLPEDAVCHRWLVLAHFNLRDWITAGRMLHRYFALLTGTPDAEILRIEPEIYANVGRLKVRLAAGETSDGVTIYLDGDAVPPVHFQIERLRLIVSPGTHVLEARAPNRQPVRQDDVVVTAGEDRTVTLPALIEQRGRLHILPVGGVVPSGVTITVDGTRVPSIHYDDDDERVFVLPGQHLIEARGSCRESTLLRVEVAAGQDLPVSVPIAERSCVYHRWWFWTLIGAAVAGGVTTGIILGTREPPPFPIGWDFQAIQIGSE